MYDDENVQNFALPYLKQTMARENFKSQSALRKQVFFMIFCSKAMKSCATIPTFIIEVSCNNEPTTSTRLIAHKFAHGGNNQTGLILNKNHKKTHSRVQPKPYLHLFHSLDHQQKFSCKNKRERKL